MAKKQAGESDEIDSKKKLAARAKDDNGASSGPASLAHCANGSSVYSGSDARWH